MTNCSYIIDGKRLPICKANGQYKSIIPEVFTGYLLKYFLGKYPFLSTEIDEVILGCALGTGGNMARFTALEAGFNVNTPAYTVDAQCASGLKSIIIADNQIKAGANSVIAGGMESNSLAPRRYYHSEDQRFTNNETEFKQASFAPNSFGENSLIKAAENVAIQLNISKSSMLDLAVDSYIKANQAIDNQYLKDIILPYFEIKQDQTIKKNMSRERLQKTETNQLIDHTNTAHIHDGACAFLVASESFCMQNSLSPSFKIIATATAAGHPVEAPLGVVWSAQELLEKTGYKIDEIDLFEVNESFAVNALAFAQYFGVNPSKMNIFGGNLAYGHPFGASGAINLLHLMEAMKFSNANKGMATIAAAGGLGMAILLERISK
jgi:acetyl-CoA C-acetyltransferase